MRRVSESETADDSSFSYFAFDVHTRPPRRVHVGRGGAELLARGASSFVVDQAPVRPDRSTLVLTPELITVHPGFALANRAAFDHALGSEGPVIVTQRPSGERLRACGLDPHRLRLLDTDGTLVGPYRLEQGGALGRALVELRAWEADRLDVGRMHLMRAGTGLLWGEAWRRAEDLVEVGGGQVLILPALPPDTDVLGVPPTAFALAGMLRNLAQDAAVTVDGRAPLWMPGAGGGGGTVRDVAREVEHAAQDAPDATARVWGRVVLGVRRGRDEVDIITEEGLDREEGNG